jgi:Ca2+-binding EF-hand superfamily protein
MSVPDTIAPNAGGLSGLKISGREGRHSMINAIYEPMVTNGQATKHNGMPCWCARSATSLYIFHTQKKRWVIGKTLDDGVKCFAFIKDTGKNGARSPSEEQDPDKGGQQWCCPDGGDWKADDKMVCTNVPQSNDKFVQLRMSINDEMMQYKLLAPADLKVLWKRLDYNGNGVVSLAEIDKMVVELVKGDIWPQWLNNKPALMRAYKKTILKDGDGDSWVEKKEFHALLLNIFWFNKLWMIFNAIDGDDRRIDVNEFQQGIAQLGLHMNQQEAQQEFAKIDTNHGGQVLFVEFCAYVRKRVNPDHNPAFDADNVSGEDCRAAMRKHHGHKATHTHMVKQKDLSEFDDLEKEFKSVCKSKKKMKDLWRRIDFNGNNIVSLAEIDKLCVEAYPLLNHKPALMRAYKATIKGPGSDGDDWVEKKEFKALLGNLIYFNKIFWLYHHVDGDNDRRLNLEEFKFLMNTLGENMSGHEVHQEFSKVDRNGGGIILFDEFCKYVTEKKCPESMTAFLD